MKNIFLCKLIKKYTKLFNKHNLYYGHSTYNAYTESIQLIYSILDLNIYKKYFKVKINKKKFKKISYLAKLRIKNRIPMAYLTKKVWFGKKKFYIDKRSIIPRSHINDKFLNTIKYKIKKKNNLKILDLCTGSACIAIICSYIFPNSIIDASDICSKTLQVAKKNILLHKKKNINIIKSNLFKNIKKKYNLIFTNPPYVDNKEIKYLPKEYFHEPKISLISKNNGLFLIKKIIKNSYKYLKKNGYLICEIGNQINKIKKYYKNKNNKLIKKINIKNNILIIKKKNLKYK